MQFNTIILRKVYVLTAIIITASVATWYFLSMMGIFPWFGTTNTKTVMQIKNLSGYDYDIVDTTVDSIAKWEYISIYLSKSRKVHGNPLLYFYDKKSLIFRYDPGMSNTLPLITSTGPNNVTISISSTSSVFVQLRKLGKLSINYDIGRIIFPKSDGNLPIRKSNHPEYAHISQTFAVIGEILIPCSY